MYEMNPIIAIVLAYLVGAIPFGLLIARAQGVNIRTQGVEILAQQMSYVY